MTSSWDRRLTVLRVLIAGYAAVWCVVRAPHLLDTVDLAARRFDPVGPLWFLGSPLPGAVVVGLVVATPALLLAVAAGWALRLTAPVAALGFLVLTTYRNSWGQLFHTENLVALHLVALAVGAWLTVPGGADRHGAGDADPARAVVRAMAVLTVGTYLVAGIAKLRIGGLDWIDGDVLRHQIAFDNTRKDLLGDPSAPFAAGFLRREWLLGPSAVATMVVELAAPLALLHRRIATVWAVAAMGFHVAILAVMLIVFPYHLLGIALAPLLPVERLGDSVAGWRSRFPARSRISAPSGSPTR